MGDEPGGVTLLLGFVVVTKGGLAVSDVEDREEWRCPQGVVDVEGDVGGMSAPYAPESCGAAPSVLLM
jgi:hypothetical protein